MYFHFKCNAAGQDNKTNEHLRRRKISFEYKEGGILTFVYSCILHWEGFIWIVICHVATPPPFKGGILKMNLPNKCMCIHGTIFYPLTKTIS